jgi:signal transduction histidine kinase
LVRGTLRACREGLRAAVRRLSLNESHRPSTSGPDAQASAGNAAILRDFRAAEQAYDELVINISHDVKTSLTVIRGHAQMMARALRRGDAIDRDALIATLNVIDTSALRISRELDGWIDGGDSPPE